MLFGVIIEPMNLDNFYSVNPIDLWRIVLGDKLHYHHAVNSNVNDPFDQAIFDLFPYIKPGSSVLDCGCGWGAPGRLLQKELGCDVTGVTIAKQQAKYINDFGVIHADLHKFIPKKKYNLALFIESYAHLNDHKKVLNNICNMVDELLIKDFVSDFPVKNDAWNLNINTKQTIFEQIESAGYKIIEYHEITDFAQPSMKYWYENLLKIDPILRTGQFKELWALCDGYMNNHLRLPFIKQYILYAKK